MAITFNQIPENIRTPGAWVEIDNSRALGNRLVQNPHKALIIGQRITEGSVQPEVLTAITNETLANGYFGDGSQIARMCAMFKENNPNTELWAVALSDAAGAVKASGTIQTSIALSATGFSCSGGGTYYLMVNGVKCYAPLTSGWSTADVNSAIAAVVNANSAIGVTASTNATSALNLIAVNGGTNGNYKKFPYLDVVLSGTTYRLDFFNGGSWRYLNGNVLPLVIVDSKNAQTFNSIPYSSYQLNVY